MNKSITILSRVAAVGALSLLTHNAQAGPVIGTGNLYQDSTSPAGANYNFAVGNSGGTGGGEAGNEVILAGSASSDLITSFSFQFDFSGNGTPAGSAELIFYANTGPGSPASPGTVLFNSGTFSLGGFTTGSTENFYQADLGGGVVVPKDFTWAVVFSGLTSDETAGLALYNPATVGANYNDAWVDTGSWGLQDATSETDIPLDFGAAINGTAAVPDSYGMPISMFFAALGLVWANQRFQKRQA